MGPCVGQQVHPCVGQGVPFAGLGHDLPAEEAQYDVERLQHPVALSGRIDAQHHGVRGQQPGTGAEHHPAAGHVVQLDDAVRDHQRVVVGQRDDAGAEAQVLGGGGRVGDEEFG